MRNFQRLRHIAGDADLATAALLPFLGGRDRFVFVFPDLKRDALDVVALANQERCRDGAVYSTAHPEKNCWTSHRGYCTEWGTKELGGRSLM